MKNENENEHEVIKDEKFKKRRKKRK